MKWITNLITLLWGMFFDKKANYRIEFKTKQIEKEWDELGSTNVKFKVMMLEVANFVQVHFAKCIMVTSILRTPQDQIKLYGYVKPSVHMYWRGVDLRSSVYEAEEIAEIVRMINTKYSYDTSRPEKSCCLYHDEGFGAHFHFQNHPNTEERK